MCNVEDQIAYLQNVESAKTSNDTKANSKDYQLRRNMTIFINSSD